MKDFALGAGRRLVSLLVRGGLGLVLLVVAFWPDWGFMWTIDEKLQGYPILWTVILAVWAGFLALALPLSALLFRKVSSLSILAIFGAVLAKLAASGVDLANRDSIVITLIVLGGVLLGWWTISVPIWRGFRNILAVDESAPEEIA